jgi:hypothetical protein
MRRSWSIAVKQLIIDGLSSPQGGGKKAQLHTFLPKTWATFSEDLQKERTKIGNAVLQDQPGVQEESWVSV